MARQRKAQTRSSKVKFVEDHKMLDAANKLAAVIESVTNEFGFAVHGQLTVGQFPQQERNKSAKGTVHSSIITYDDPKLSPYVQAVAKAKKIKRQTYSVFNTYSATR